MITRNLVFTVVIWALFLTGCDYSVPPVEKKTVSGSPSNMKAVIRENPVPCEGSGTGGGPRRTFLDTENMSLFKDNHGEIRNEYGIFHVIKRAPSARFEKNGLVFHISDFKLIQGTIKGKGEDVFVSKSNDESVFFYLEFSIHNKSGDPVSPTINNEPFCTGRLVKNGKTQAQWHFDHDNTDHQIVKELDYSWILEPNQKISTFMLIFLSGNPEDADSVELVTADFQNVNSLDSNTRGSKIILPIK